MYIKEQGEFDGDHGSYRTICKATRSITNLSGWAVSLSPGYLSVCKKSSSTSDPYNTVRSYPGYRRLKRLGVFLLPPGWDANPSH